MAEGGGLLNRYRVVKPYRGFESLRLRQFRLVRPGDIGNRQPEISTAGRQYRSQKIAIGEMGIRGALVYCSDCRCSHSTAITADCWPDHVGLSENLKELFVCQACAINGPASIAAKEQTFFTLVTLGS